MSHISPRNLVRLLAARVLYYERPGCIPALKVLTPNSHLMYCSSTQSNSSNRNFYWNLGLTFDIEVGGTFTLVISESGISERRLGGSKAERPIRVSYSQLLCPSGLGYEVNSSVLEIGVLRTSRMMVTLTYELIIVPDRSTATTDNVYINGTGTAALLNGSNGTTIGDSTLSNIIGDQINNTVNIIIYHSTAKYGETVIFIAVFVLMAFVIAGIIPKE